MKRARTARELLIAFGPPAQWSGFIASVIGAERRKLMTDAWKKMTPRERAAVLHAFKLRFRKETGTGPSSTKRKAKRKGRIR